MINFAMILLAVTGATFHITGRVTSIAVDPSDPSGNTYRVEANSEKNKSVTDPARDQSGNTIYVGSANGGVWK